jgi:hypothetical protein
VYQEEADVVSALLQNEEGGHHLTISLLFCALSVLALFASNKIKSKLQLSSFKGQQFKRPSYSAFSFCRLI